LTLQKAFERRRRPSTVYKPRKDFVPTRIG
jgi:hypothetical protein